MEDVAAITFDVGGTLIEPWPSVGHAYAEVAARHGVDAAPEEITQRFVEAWRRRGDFEYTKAGWAALVDETFAGLTTTSVEVKRGKSAPDLFLKAAEKHGVAPENCLVIEDSFPGIRAALAAGMEVWRFTGGSHMTGLNLPSDPVAMPHREFASFAEFFHPAPHLSMDPT